MTSDAISISLPKRGLLCLLVSILVNTAFFTLFNMLLKDDEVRPLVVRLRPVSLEKEKSEDEILKKLESESFKINSMTLKKGDTIEDKKRAQIQAKELVQKTIPKKPTEKVKPKSNVKKEQPLDFAALAPQLSEVKEIPKAAPAPESKKLTDLGHVKKDQTRIQEQESLTKKQILNEFAATPDIAKVLDSKGFNMEFGLPEGLNEDDLNSKELIYFAFLRRNFLKYLTTFLTTHNKLVISRPSLTYALKTGPHLLTARAIYDDQGNMVSFKILKSSLNNDIHQLFEETVKGMRTIPNPPRDFVKGRDKEFSVYYQLQINGV